MPDPDYFDVLPDDKARSMRLPLRMETDRFRGFHDDERMIAWGYWDTGELMSVQDTETGKLDIEILNIIARATGAE